MFDLFNHRFFFRIRNRSHIITSFSTLISFLVFLPLMILFLVYTVGAFNRTNPHINVQEMDIKIRPSIDLNTNNYRMGLRFQTRAGITISPADLPNYLNVTVNYHRITSHENGTEKYREAKTFGFKSCEESNFSDFDSYYKLNLQNAICLTNHSMTLEGYWDESTISYAFIQINFCNQSTNPHCKNRKEIANLFRGGYLYLHTETQNVNSLYYEHPCLLSMKTIQFILDTNVRNEVSVYFQKMELSTYDGLIYNGDATEQEFYKQTYYTANSMSISEDENLIWSCYFLSSTKILTVERYYMTLLEVAGIVGGLSKFLIVFGFIITGIYNERVLACNLLNELYYFDFGKVTPKDKLQDKVEIKNDDLKSALSQDKIPSGLTPNANSPYFKNMIALDAEEHLELVDLNQNQKSLGSRNVIKSDNFLKSKSDIESPENLPPRNIKNFEDHIIQNSHKDKVKIEVNANTIEIETNKKTNVIPIKIVEKCPEIRSKTRHPTSKTSNFQQILRSTTTQSYRSFAFGIYNF